MARTKSLLTNKLCTAFRERKRTQDELALQEEVEHLRTRIEAGEADVEVEVAVEAEVEDEQETEEGATAQEETPEVATFTVQMLLERKEAELVTLSETLDEKFKCGPHSCRAVAVFKSSRLASYEL